MKLIRVGFGPGKHHLRATALLEAWWDTGIALPDFKLISTTKTVQGKVTSFKRECIHPTKSRAGNDLLRMIDIEAAECKRMTCKPTKHKYR